MYCIYKITNKINNKTYIGQHKYKDESNPMGKYKGSGKLLWKAYEKYGFENFITEVLYERIRDKSTVDAMEIWAIEKYKPEYNIAKGGTGGDTWSCLSDDKKCIRRKHYAEASTGRHFSNESRIKKSKTLKKFYENNPQEKQRISERMKGENNPTKKYGLSEEQITRFTEYAKKSKTDEHKKHISEAKTKYYKENKIVLSDTHKLHIKEAVAKRMSVKENRNRISETCKRNMIEVREAYKSNNHGLSWNEFQKYYKTVRSEK